eukprot:353393-Chlamydomonas_euryale.AAC.4
MPDPKIQNRIQRTAEDQGSGPEAVQQSHLCGSHVATTTQGAALRCCHAHARTEHAGVMRCTMHMPQPSMQSI